MKKTTKDRLPDSDEILQLPLWGMLLFTAQCIRNIQSVLWSAPNTIEEKAEWTVVVNKTLGFVEKAAAAPEFARSRSFWHDSEELYKAVEDQAENTKLVAKYEVARVLHATLHLAGCARIVRDISKLLIKKKTYEAK